jgi:hypothetical protein
MLEENRPDWKTSPAGTRVRVALWLMDAVGIGNAFTKAQLRDAFPGVEQIDRRMRELRPDGWVIATSRDDRSLDQDELRLVAAGSKVWEGGYSRGEGSPKISAKARTATFAADGYVCVLCGIGAGETFPDDQSRAARLTCQRVTSPDGTTGLRTVCDRCHAGGQPCEASAAVLDAVRRLDAQERQALEGWVARGERERRPADRVWARLRRLPAADRAAIADAFRM